MQSVRTRILLAAATAAAAVGALLGGATPATATAVDTDTVTATATTLCGQYDKQTIQNGRYIVQNNRWGTENTNQCIEVTESGFRISQQDGVKPTTGAPISYPSVFWGCHYDNCTNDFKPVRASSSDFPKVGTKVSMTYPSTGTYNGSYDIWFDPTERRGGQNTGLEIMVWLKKTGAVQPFGTKVATKTIAGVSYDVWTGRQYTGNGDFNVVSYVRTTASGTADFLVKDFYNDALLRKCAVNVPCADTSWYLTSVQAGFEPWSGGTGLSLTNFTAGLPVVITCAAAFKVVNSWPGGFQAEVTVSNTGTGSSTTWQNQLTWPGTQKISDLWNATGTQTGATLTANNATWNGPLAVGASTQYGMVVQGATASPKSLTCKNA
ncbi:GH12 family glycosyl hydrolase domain-containing protein [Kineosporia babensis]|uniref:Cellulose binding domain-containing protein n=1 Tax=Kineosporia babensis TaxID=499548 RepID=A0A9X1T1B2_9ACTN|nr:cellulose binding domain-containing protein [Kineosporia babensis]MCD5313663.1 cellulose binding domain-containing protein [Kineosporia babensis]